MADKLKINLKSYQAYEEGRSEPKLSKIVDISCSLNFTMDELIKINMAVAYTEQQMLLLSVKPRTISKQPEIDTNRLNSDRRQ